MAFVGHCVTIPYRFCCLARWISQNTTGIYSLSVHCAWTGQKICLLILKLQGNKGSPSFSELPALLPTADNWIWPRFWSLSRMIDAQLSASHRTLMTCIQNLFDLQHAFFAKLYSLGASWFLLTKIFTKKLQTSLLVPKWCHLQYMVSQPSFQEILWQPWKVNVTWILSHTGHLKTWLFQINWYFCFPFCQCRKLAEWKTSWKRLVRHINHTQEVSISAHWL